MGGSLTNVGYFLASAACAAAAYRATRAGSRTSSGTWLAIGLAIAALGIFRELGLAQWLDVQLRLTAKSAGWYAHRRTPQILVLAAFVGALVAACVFMSLRTGRAKGPVNLALLVLAALAVLAVIRATSLHWTDQVLDLRLGAFSLSQMIQWVCLVVTGVAAAWSSFSVGRTPPSIRQISDPGTR